MSGLEWRRGLSRRATDLHVAETVPGSVPLAVGADRIAAVAMRAAGLLAALADGGQLVDRTRSGRLLEVYQAAALWMSGLTSRSNKVGANRAVLSSLVDDLQAALPRLDWQGHYRRYCHSLTAPLRRSLRPRSPSMPRNDWRPAALRRNAGCGGRPRVVAHDTGPGGRSLSGWHPPSTRGACSLRKT